MSAMDKKVLKGEIFLTLQVCTPQNFLTLEFTCSMVDPDGCVISQFLFFIGLSFFEFFEFLEFLESCEFRFETQCFEANCF